MSTQSQEATTANNAETERETFDSIEPDDQYDHLQPGGQGRSNRKQLTGKGLKRETSKWRTN